MRSTESKWKERLMLLTLYVSTFSIMGDMVASVIASALYERYGDFLANLMITGPSLASLVACPLGGWLADRMDKKKLLLAGYLLYAVSGILGAASTGAAYIITCRFLATGVAYGLTSSAAMGILSDSYPDEAARGKVVGIYNAVMALMGAAFGMLCGILAQNDWRNAFMANWLAVPVIVLIVLFVPACPARPHAPQQSAQAAGAQRSAGRWFAQLIPLLVMFFLVASCYYVIAYMLDLYVSFHALGNSATTGTLGAVGTVASCITCTSFGFLYGRWKERCVLPAIALLAVGFLLLAAFPSLPVATAGCAIMGLAWGMIFSYIYLRCTVVVPEDKVGSSIGITSTINSLSMLLCPYILQLLMRLLHTEDAGAAYYVYGGVVAVVFLVFLLQSLRKRR